METKDSLSHPLPTLLLQLGRVNNVKICQELKLTSPTQWLQCEMNLFVKSPIQPTGVYEPDNSGLVNTPLDTTFYTRPL